MGVMSRSEAELSLVELALELAVWVSAADMVLDLLYTAAQSEAPGLSGSAASVRETGAFQPVARKLPAPSPHRS